MTRTHCPVLNIPHAQGAICTATEQAAAIRGEGHAIYIGGMPKEHRSIAALFDIPEPDGFVIAATGQDASIGTPGDTIAPGPSVPEACGASVRSAPPTA